MPLPDAVARHVQVLRLSVNDVITVFNGRGGEYAATLVGIEKKHVQVELKIFSAREAEPAHALTLAQALPEGSKMDWIVEKAVELGATAIQPLAAARSVVRLSPERTEKKMAHWQGIMAAAAEQCGRNRVPLVAEAIPAVDYVAPEGTLKLLLVPGAHSGLRSQPIDRNQPIVLAAGPEAGFSPREDAKLLATGFLPIHLGPRVLRTETAGPAALAALNALYGDG